MFRRILVCTDLSLESDTLVECVKELRTVGMKEVILAHAIPYADARLPEDMQRLLDGQVRTLTEQGVVVTVEMPTGPAAVALAEAAEIRHASAIFVGSHGKGIVQAATIGSVSEGILHRARCPVLLARIGLLSGQTKFLCQKILTRVLFPTDFSETSERAMEYLGSIAKETGASITLLHVVEEQESDSAEEAAQYLLNAKKRRLQAAGAVDVTILTAKGSPQKEVVALARTGSFSLMVMGFKGKGLLKEVWVGSVVHEAARHSGVPILFIPAPE